MSMDRFHTRARASEGRKVFLADPATGKLTNDWLIIRSRWCDEFQEAKSVAVQSAFTDAKEGDAALKKAASDDRRFDLLCALVGGWSFDTPFTPEAVKAFLREAPQIVDEIDRLAVKDSFFFRKAPGSS